jgi:hypothetical protein
MKINKKDMTQEILLKCLTYDPATGFLHRRYKYHNNVIEGKRACRPCGNKKQDHLDVTLWGRNYPAHRVIWAMHHGTFPKGHIDHIDHDETNNKLNNLREVTQAENNRNNSKRCDNTTGRVGVWINKNNVNKKFMAEIRDLNKKKVCKSFCSLEEAIAQREIWEKEFNYHSNHGIDKSL